MSKPELFLQDIFPHYFDSVIDSDDGTKVQRDPVFNMKDINDPKLELKMIFPNLHIFKEAVYNYSVKRGRPCRFTKQDKYRVRAKCKDEKCQWYCYARYLEGDGRTQLRTYDLTHTCGFTYESPLVHSGWVAKKYTEEFRLNPKMDLRQFRMKVMRENKCKFTQNQTYRVKEKALKIIHGSATDQYHKLRPYMHEIHRSNPGSTVIMKIVDGYKDASTSKERFERLYICFAGVKQGFLAGCRQFFGVDGTFLKGSVGGMLLTTVGVDANNSIYPVVYAVVEGETIDSWAWFFRLLKEDLKIENDFEWTIMSDKQKCLIKACEEVFPNAAHRFCVKHMHSNFSLAGFREASLRSALWAIAKATTPTQFATKMEELAEIDYEAAKWFDDKPPNQWSRAYFSIHSKCAMLLNNICECFNSKILTAREKPIIEMMELLRLNMMQRLQRNRNVAKKKWQKYTYCPRILEMLQKNIEIAPNCFPFQSTDDLYEVSCPFGEQYGVNIKDQTCGCRKWELTGIPCPHAVAALWMANKDPVQYISSWYTVEKYLKCYEGWICPVNGELEWGHDSSCVGPLPPLSKKGPGRPKKLRRRNADELQQQKEKKTGKMSRVGQINRCKYCKQPGHNQRSCNLLKNAPVAENEVFSNADDRSKHSTSKFSKKKVQKIVRSHETEAVESLFDVDVISQNAEDVDMFGIFGLKRSQVKYSNKISRPSPPGKAQLQVPLRITNVHIQTTTAATTKSKPGPECSSNSKGKKRSSDVKFSHFLSYETILEYLDNFGTGFCFTFDADECIMNFCNSRHL